MEDKVRLQLEELLGELHPEIDFETEEALMDDGILDSFDIVELVTEVDEIFEIEIPAVHLVPHNFNNIESMCDLVLGLMEQVKVE